MIEPPSSARGTNTLDITPQRRLQKLDWHELLKKQGVIVLPMLYDLKIATNKNMLERGAYQINENKFLSSRPCTTTIQRASKWHHYDVLFM